MKRWLSAALVGLPLWAGVAVAGDPATRPAVERDDGAARFQDRIKGIAFTPPAGGLMMRQLDTGDIVRFVYTDPPMDLRVKPVPVPASLQLTAPPTPMAAGGLLEITALQLTQNNSSAEILRSEVVSVGGQKVGIIEARYNAGIDREFAQQALFRSTPEKYFSVQMVSPGRAKDAPAGRPDPAEAHARDVFAQTLKTVQLLNTRDLIEEQEHRLEKSRMAFVLMDRNKIRSILDHEHYMRVLSNGVNIGYVQMNEREVTRNGNDGIEVIVRSHIEQVPAAQPASPAVVQPAPAPGGIVLPRPIDAGLAAAANAAPDGPPKVDSDATYFVTFDREHEIWSSTLRFSADHSQLSELGNSDVAIRRMLDALALRKQAVVGVPGQKGNPQPPVLTRPERTISVTPRRGKLFEEKLGIPFYLPQALGQLLPRLLPTDPGQYMFACYVGDTNAVMSRYVDVDRQKSVTLDGRAVRGVPISDRIGLEGIPTVHYVTPAGEWLGSVNEQTKLEVVPDDAAGIKAVWKGFSPLPEPPLPVDPPKGARGSIPPARRSVMQGPGMDGR